MQTIFDNMTVQLDDFTCEKLCFNSWFNEYDKLSELIEAINKQTDNIGFDRIPIKYWYDNEVKAWQFATTYRYYTCLSYILLDMFNN